MAAEEDKTRGPEQRGGERPAAPKNTVFAKQTRRLTPHGKKRGGGPKTAAGREVVRRNPIKHGVFAQTPVLPLVEDENDWRRLRQDVLDWFQLEGEFQESLGERVAMLIWRLKRVARMETEAVRHYQEDVPADWRASMHMTGMPIPDRKTKERVEEEYRMMMARLLPGEELMDKVLRYESRLHRYLLQMIYMIMVMKGLIPAATGRLYGVAALKPPEVSRRREPPERPAPEGE